MTTAPKTSQHHSASSVAENSETGKVIVRLMCRLPVVARTVTSAHLTD
jgi:hypothetical protein